MNRVAAALDTAHDAADDGHDSSVITTLHLFDSFGILRGTQGRGNSLNDLISGSSAADKALLLCNGGGHARISINNRHHHLLGVGDSDSLTLMHHRDELDELLVAEVVLEDRLEAGSLLLAVVKDVVVDPNNSSESSKCDKGLIHNIHGYLPLVDELGVDLK